MKSVRIFPDINTLAESIALRFREEAKQAAKENRLYSVVLAGGVTASKAYQLLRDPGFVGKIPWKSVHLFWTDERCVFPDSPESNFGTSYRTFLNAVPIPDENIHRIRGEENPEIEASRYACELRNHFALKNNPKQGFDWVLLGLGTDGHTASLFPGQDALLRPLDFCDVARHPQTNQNRITMTTFAFQHAEKITYHVTGLEKASVVSDLIIQSIGSEKYPAAQISGEWYLDEAAASCLDL